MIMGRSNASLNLFPVPETQTQAKKSCDIHGASETLYVVIGRRNASLNLRPISDSDYFVEKKPYDPIEDRAIHEAVANSAGGIVGMGLGKVFGLIFRGGITSRGTIEVTEASIAKALEGSTMQTLQGRVSLPMIQRYVKMLQEGHVAPPIKVADGIIVEGNHRYIAGRLFGVEPAQVPFIVPPSQMNRAMPIQKTTVDLLDWGGH
jgi:hypothetical protein